MSTQPGTKRKRFLAPQEKYEIWMQLVRGETTVARQPIGRGWTGRRSRSCARSPGRARLDALARSRPGRRDKQRDVELEAAQAEIERLRTALAEMAVRLTLVEGKEPWG